jgi:cobalt-zinc-cadmium efflux system membrane fusion protein
LSDITGMSSLWTTRNAIAAVLVISAMAAGIAIDRAFLNPMPSGPEKPKITTRSRNLTIGADQIKNADIKIVRIAAGSLIDQIVAQATVAATPDGAAIIGARADGTVIRITHRLGDVVRAGESMGRIQSRDAARLAEDRASAQARLVRAQQAFTRQKNLMAANATARQDFDAAQSEWRIAQAELSRSKAANAASGVSGDGVSLDIISPIAGRITAAPAMLGSYVIAGTELFRVADPTKLEVQAAVPSADVRRITVGDGAMIELLSGPIAATVRAITPDLNTQSRTATVILVPRGDAGTLQPGQLVATRITVAHGHSDLGTVLVPTEALQKIDGGDAVFLRTKAGFHAQPVTAGAESGAMTEIRAGLKPGGEIATTNSFLLKAEMEKESAGDE